MVHNAAALIIGLSVLASAGLSFAEQDQARTSSEKAAKKACAMGDFQRGADILTDLFVETNDVNYVYNQGRCYQQNNRWEQAISRFREYLRKAKDLSAADRADTEQQIADCEALLAKATQPALPPVSSQPTVPTSQVESPSPRSQPSQGVATAQSQQPSAGSRGNGLRVTGIVLASVGLASVGAGVALAWKTHGLSTADYSRSREDERSSLRTWGLLSYGVGAASIVTGAVLYIVGRHSEQSPGLALLPMIAPEGASVLLRGSF